ncbi:hypothetical protein TI05_00620 [Achromatium sp. WMS3]|nr:hypothetical protein TI05_00620 [Achromatium sp. WMS3]
MNTENITFFVCGTPSDKIGFEYIASDKSPKRDELKKALDIFDTPTMEHGRTVVGTNKLFVDKVRCTLIAIYEGIIPNDKPTSRGAYIAAGALIPNQIISDDTLIECGFKITEIHGRLKALRDTNNTFPTKFNLNEFDFGKDFSVFELTKFISDLRQLQEIKQPSKIIRNEFDKQDSTKSQKISLKHDNPNVNSASPSELDRRVTLLEIDVKKLKDALDWNKNAIRDEKRKKKQKKKIYTYIVFLILIVILLLLMTYIFWPSQLTTTQQPETSKTSINITKNDKTSSQNKTGATDSKRNTTQPSSAVQERNKAIRSDY